MPVLSLSKGRRFAGVGARSAQNLDLLSLAQGGTVNHPFTHYIAKGDFP
jgi:hypothetical protein